MEMTRKEAIKKLKNIFLKQDHETLAKLCANLVSDLNSFLHIDRIPSEEAEYLLQRTRTSMDEIAKFLKKDDEENNKVELVEAPFFSDDGANS